MYCRFATWILTVGLVLASLGWANSLQAQEDDSEPGLFPAEELKTEEPTGKESDSAEVEIVRERYPNRAVKVEREVIRDAEDNYVNHGSWRMWDTKGNLIAEGQYRHGHRHGEWTGWYDRKEAKMLSTAPFKDFSAPFISCASFKDGELDERWVIYDSKQRKVIDVEYADGVRHGKWTYFYVSGRPMRETHYRNGVIDGSMREWTPDGKLTVDHTYENGRRLGRKVDFHPNKQKKSEGMYLYARRVPSGPDDWWNLKLATFLTEGEDQKHGDWKAWYANGQQRVLGQYDRGLPKTEVTWSWWYENGQKAVEGSYENGHKDGKWLWWHENGQKKIEGAYVLGAPSGRWIWWQTSGRVSQKVEYAAGEGNVVGEEVATGDDPVVPIAEGADAAVQVPQEASEPRHLKFRK